MTHRHSPYHRDDVVLWPDGTWATVGEVRDGNYDWKSDDFEIVRIEDTDRLKALGLGEAFKEYLE